MASMRDMLWKVATTFLLVVGLAGAAAPTQARFLSVDPVEPDANTGANFNRYGYANNNPYRYIDPDGRLPILIPVVFGVSLYFTANYANAPAPSGAHYALSTSEQIAPFLQAAPFGRAAGAFNAIGNGDKTYTTYTRSHADGAVYSGRTSGTGTPEQQLAKRMQSADHKEKTEAGFQPPTLDKNTPSLEAARGREQQLVIQNGGAQSQGGTSANKINAVSPNNPNAERYEKACAEKFGC